MLCYALSFVGPKFIIAIALCGHSRHISAITVMFRVKSQCDNLVAACHMLCEPQTMARTLQGRKEGSKHAVERKAPGGAVLLWRRLRTGPILEAICDEYRV